MKCNYKGKWDRLSNTEQEAIARFCFKSAVKSIIAITLYRCDRLRHWKNNDLRRLYEDMVSIFKMKIFDKQISDEELIKYYEKLLDVDFSIFDDIVEVKYF